MERKGRVDNISPELFLDIAKMLIIEKNKQVKIIGRSMEPTIMEGDVIQVETDSISLEIGDIITFINHDHLTTHRIIDIQYENNEKYFITKGDANKNSKEKISGKMIIGKMIQNTGGEV